jgi:hypothetical protein
MVASKVVVRAAEMAAARAVAMEAERAAVRAVARVNGAVVNGAVVNAQLVRAFGLFVIHRLHMDAPEAAAADALLSALAPPAERLTHLSARAEAILSGSPPRLEEAIELRQHCLALAQLACRDDSAQLARAAADLGAAYLQAGHFAAAARHAANAESLLLQAAQPEPSLHAHILVTLATALADSREHARALECFPRALVQSESAFGKRHLSTCPMLRAFARLAAARNPPDFARATQLLEAERRIRLEHASEDEVSAPADVRAQLELTQLDQERAILLLRHAKHLDQRAAHAAGPASAGAIGRGGGKAGAGAKAGARPATMRERPMPLQTQQPQQPQEPPQPHAKHRRAGGGSAHGGAHSGDGGGVLIEMSASEMGALATRKRQEAAELLRSAADAARPSETAAQARRLDRLEEEAVDVAEEEEEEEGDSDEARSPTEARLAVQLAAAYAELEQWHDAERSYLRALPYYERSRGHANGTVISLWVEVAALRMRRRAYSAAARDHAHVLEMQKVLHGPRAAELIPTAERLCKAHVLMRQWREAREALSFVFELVSERHGPEHRETARVADVLKSLDKYAGPESAEELAN